MLRQPKRPDLLVEIAKEAQNLRFVVCGGPSDHRSPKDYGTEIIAALSALPNVDYRGQVSPAAADDVIANASALLCTSDGEGFPNIFLEAWASGTPVVSLKIDPDDVMMRNEIGLVSRDIQTTISNLTSLINQPQRREEMAVRSRSYVTEAHSEPAVVSRFQRALEDRHEATRAVTIPPA
jgi:glycosyltransferase involved in cell wall biosynthesis